MRAAIIRDGAVWNIVDVESLAGSPFTLVACGPDVRIGDLYDGQVFSRPAVVPAVPQEVTMRQARLALIDAGKLALVDTLLDSLAEPMKTRARAEWEYSSTVQRTHPFVMMLGTQLGIDLDALFVAASRL